jgi:hypothetical protein
VTRNLNPGARIPDDRICDIVISHILDPPLGLPLAQALACQQILQVGTVRVDGYQR